MSAQHGGLFPPAPPPAAKAPAPPPRRRPAALPPFEPRRRQEATIEPGTRVWLRGSPYIVTWVDGWVAGAVFDPPKKGKPR